MHKVNWNKYRKKEKEATVLNSKLSFSDLPFDLQVMLLEMDFCETLRENVKEILNLLGVFEMPDEERILVEDMVSVAMVIKVISLETILTNIKYDKKEAGLSYDELSYRKAFDSFSDGLDVDLIELLKLLKETFKSNYTLDNVWE